MTDTLPDIVYPSIKQGGNPPEVVSKRGGDVRAYDRRLERHVYGPRHHFQETTDILVTNGLFRFWVGNRGLPAFLNVEAFASGIWNHVGYIRLSDSDTLQGAKLEKVTPDAATVRLNIRSQGPCFVTLKRGERGVRVLYGSEIGPVVSATRTIRWAGTPPYAEFSGASEGTGLFDSGLHNSSGRVRFTWPGVGVGAWSLYAVWLPLDDNAGDGTGELDHWGDSTWGTGEWGGQFGLSPARLLTLEDSAGEVGDVSYDNVSKRIEFTLAGEQVVSPAISFAAGAAVRVLARFSTDDGMALSVKVGSGAVSHASDSSATDSGTNDQAYTVHSIGPVSDGQMGGVFDQTMVLDDRLSDAEAAALLAQGSRADGISPEGRLVWFAPFDASLDATVTSDAVGLSKRAMPTLAIYASDAGETSDFGAYLTTNEPGDSPTEVLEQFVADSEQEVRLR